MRKTSRTFPKFAALNGTIAPQSIHDVEKQLASKEFVPIEEKEFRIACNTNAVTNVAAIEVDGGHLLVLTVSYRREELTLVTLKKRPRVWSSMNTLIDYLKRNGLQLNRLIVVLTPLNKPI